jgi:selenocysteine-specific elongation factor
MSEERHIVVGTAGHVDHGKTALVQALTGFDCDQLPEEKARGITIQLGFAEWPISSTLGASIVDVPGHERFVRTMVAGAGGLDCVLLVVAADDGVMAQTREHLAICELLGVRAGVVVLTKCDLASPDLLELVEADVRLATRGTFLASAEIVHCSARSREGIDRIGPAVVRAWKASGDRDDGGPAFLGIDRVFTRAGAGTIVTGTLVRGNLRVGDEVDVLPVAKRVRIRALQVHGTAKPEARARVRVALNLHGDAVREIHRGMAIAAPDSTTPTCEAHGLVTLLQRIEKRTTMKLHLGTATVEVGVTLLEQREEQSVVRISSREPFPTFAGQRFVVRRSGQHGEETAFGGTIVDPAPRARRRRGQAFFFEAKDPLGGVRLLVGEAGHAGVSRAAIVFRCPATWVVGDCLRELVEAGAIVEIADRFYADEVFEEAKGTVLTLVRELARDKPLLSGMASAEIVTRCPRVASLVPLAIATLTKRGEVSVHAGLVRSRDDAAGSERSEVLASVLARYRSAGLAPPSDEVVRDEIALPPAAFREAITELKRDGVLRLVGGFHFDVEALASLRTKVTEHFTSHEALTPVDLKGLCGLTRRHAIPLLEWLDREGVTRRQGDVRVAGAAVRRSTSLA